LRRALPPAEKEAQSSAVCARILAHKLWITAHTVVAYVSTADEVDTWPLLRAALALGKHLVLPATEDGAIAWFAVPDLSAGQLVKGVLGITEPVRTARRWKPDVADGPVIWLVPGVGFDLCGRRLGRGGGYYDRALREAGACHGTVGLAFSCQLMDAIPVDDGDWPVEFVATPERWVAAVNT
jgi:5-formyltetrahydrofolate cyclo-ligase